MPIHNENDAISILYVEDEQDARDTLLSILETRFPGERFHTAGNGLQGVQLFRSIRPAIVITDISMPELDGLSMAAEIKSLCPETIIIAVTASSETRDLLQAIEIGVNHYVLKPLDFGRISTVLDQAIASVRKDHQLHARYEQINELNAALTARTRELEAANHDLEAFNHTVAHDLRTPLMSIGGFSKYILDSFAEGFDDKCKECLHVIYKETIRMSNIIEAMLEFSSYSRKEIEKEVADLSSIANEVRYSLLLREPHRKATFSIAEGVTGLCDPVLLGIVIENMLTNAWKYSSKKENACIEFGTLNKDTKLVYFVRDNGVGFDKREAEHLFAPFQRFQHDNDTEGFGIGLATANRIIQRHGGKIWAEGKKNEGATFYFTL
jgi:signal transduction histidine kinase